mgnify:CR=1 FL=1
MDTLLDFWELIIQEDDQSFIFFFSVALLIYHKQVTSLFFTFLDYFRVWELQYTYYDDQNLCKQPSRADYGVEEVSAWVYLIFIELRL